MAKSSVNTDERLFSKGLALVASMVLLAGCSDDASPSADDEVGETDASTETDTSETESETETGESSETTESTDTESTDSTESTDEAESSEESTDTGEDEGLSCAYVSECVEACAGDQACADACAMEGSALALEEYTALEGCAIECLGDEACILTTCVDLIVDCYTGELSCSESIDCAGMCAGDAQCTEECFATATALGQIQADNLEQCFSNSDCPPNDLPCIEQECGGPLGDCTSGTADEAHCVFITDCFGLCEGEPLCQSYCLAAGSELGSSEAEALIECAIDQGCQDEACLMVACGESFDACVSGEASCTETFACTEACEDSNQCEEGCFYDASFAAQSQYQDVIDCAVANACADEACVQANCGGELAACGF